ncbi:MAG: helix-turn-helix domain-containing protein [Cyanobacteria bacterium]|nr:helix-turn-helix domain-containing protein [Cyanobacteriota bacterium]MDW8199899.1 helix-turn-helix domain-containing protein [Cyanobacteriota bacterium SKYGB_h_bin112]
MNRFSASQVEQLWNVVTVLKQRRLEQSVSLEEIAAKTYIQLRLLKALEEHRLDELPEPVFVQGFIRKCGDILGLDGSALAASVINPQSAVSVPLLSSGHAAVASDNEQLVVPRQSIDILKEEQPSTAKASDDSDLKAANLTLVRSTLKALPSKRLKVFSRRSPGVLVPVMLPIAALSMGIVALAVVIPRFGLFSQQPLVPPPSPSVSASVSPESLPLLPPPQRESLVEVSVTLTDESWLQINLDGKEAFSGILPKGAERKWSAKELVSMQIGNAGAVLLSINGSDAKPAGDPGEVRELQIKPTDDGSLLNQQQSSAANRAEGEISTVTF